VICAEGLAARMAHGSHLKKRFKTVKTQRTFKHLKVLLLSNEKLIRSRRNTKIDTVTTGAVTRYSTERYTKCGSAHIAVQIRP
jgi:hypothetical protein